MSDYQGMDVEYARSAANSMDGGVNAIHGVINGVSANLESVMWIGSDASNFSGDWHGTFVPQLHGATNALSDNARVLSRRADMQEEASGT